MSYAIIRNIKYQRKQLSAIYRHNERKNTHYSNKDIITEISKKNYSLKNINTTYEKEFENIHKKYNLKGQLKVTSNIACEFIITSDKDFFEKIGEQETKRFFETAYKFVSNYQSLGEQYILSAKVHLDETTPHLHIVFIPVVHTKDKKGNYVDKICCTEYWKGKDSYRKLQDNFYNYITKAGFNLQRGKSMNNEHIPIETLKTITEYDNIKYELEKTPIKELETNNITELKEYNTQLIKYCNKLRTYYIKSIKAIEKCIELKNENQELKYNNEKLANETFKLKQYLDIIDFPKDKL